MPTNTNTEPDTWTALVELVTALDRRFPDHNSALARVSRLCEETGEVASAVNHTEGMGIKHDKHGPPDTANLVKELQDVLRATVGLAVHYGVETELVASIHHHRTRYQDMGFLPQETPPCSNSSSPATARPTATSTD